MPMSNADGQVWITYNGEIYNAAELRAISKSAVRFRSTTDTEVVLHLYEEFGEDCVKKFGACLPLPSGMFASANLFWRAIVSASSRCIICDSGGNLVFASET